MRRVVNINELRPAINSHRRQDDRALQAPGSVLIGGVISLLATCRATATTFVRKWRVRE